LNSNYKKGNCVDPKSPLITWIFAAFVQQIETFTAR
jgi:hypothetical protein